VFESFGSALRTSIEIGFSNLANAFLIASAAESMLYFNDSHRMAVVAMVLCETFETIFPAILVHAMSMCILQLGS
jgi:hypothetical protein